MYRYEVGQSVCILKTMLAGHSGKITNRRISVHGRICYEVYGWSFDESELEAL